jgi:hypothetical protein
MTNYGMFTDEGNAKVQNIVVKARNLHENLGYPLKSAWDWAQNELAGLGNYAKTEEAEDTAVREAVYNAII